MPELVSAEAKILNLIELLKTSGGLAIDADIDGTSMLTAPDHPALSIKLSGEDAHLFARNNGELLIALHHVVAAAIGLPSQEHDRLWFDVDHLRSDRMAQLQHIATAAVDSVRSTLRPHAFDPMRSCDRYMLRLALAPSGLRYTSHGVEPHRCVILYPEELFSAEEASPLLFHQEPVGDSNSALGPT